MESRKVKVIDEHGIDRESSIICKFTIDDSAYVLYYIERDSENDNLFVSKLVNNNDGTSSMVNVEDSMEKNKINDVIKELITYSINNEDAVLNGKVVLPDGRNVDISNVLLNKEQNINVSKTYVTTVKKAVTKVSEDFYKVNEVREEPTSQIFEAMKDNVFDTPVVTEKPSLEAGSHGCIRVPVAAVVPELPKVEPIIPNPVVAGPSKEEVKQDAEIFFNQNEEKRDETVAPESPMVETNSNDFLTNNSSLTHIELPKVEPIIPNPVVAGPSKGEVKQDAETIFDQNDEKRDETVVPESPMVETNSNDFLTNNSSLTHIELPKVEPIIPMPGAAELPKEEVKPSLESLQPSVLPLEQSVKSDSSESKLFFDGSKETNLNMALGEVSEEKTLSTESEGVQALRQFGSDEPVLPPQEQVLSEKEDVKTLTRSKGFVNNKFFMVIAIAFFVAACVFLGYEVFQYFQIVK